MSPDVPASVRARLLNQARAGGEAFERTLVRFAAERWLYRLGESAARDRCVLKGAALLTVWVPNPHRMTRDVDLLAYGHSDETAIRALMQQVCAVACPEDGVVFDLSELTLAPIRAQEEYAGLRALFWARLGQAKMRMQVDVGFGDALPGRSENVVFPTMLSHLPPARVRAYPREQSLAEKFEAMVKLERRNSRMKDFHDVWSLSMTFPFEGASLSAAIAACFARRATPWTPERPGALTPAFYEDPELQGRWQGYLRGGSVRTAPPGGFADVGRQVTGFLGPVRDSIVGGAPFTAEWPPGGPWLFHAQERQ